MKNLILILLIGIFSSGCESNKRAERGEPRQNIVYVKDPTTGACFVESRTSDGWFVYSYIPCDLTIKRYKGN